MSDILTLALNTTNKLSTIDRAHFLGGKLVNASSVFLNTTSNIVASILNRKFNRLQQLIAIKTHIANRMIYISTNFMNKTGNLLGKLLKTTSSSTYLLPDHKSNLTENILDKSINLVNVTGQSLVNVMDATSVLFAKSTHDDHTQFVAELLNSTTNILNATTNSLGVLLNITNQLIVDVQPTDGTNTMVLNQTANLLSASCKTIATFLNATMLLISNSASNELSIGIGHRFTIGAINVTKSALKDVFQSTITLLEGVIASKKDISTRLITTTAKFLDASIQIKASLFNATIDKAKYITNSTAHFIASKLHATADKLTSHLDVANETQIPLENLENNSTSTINNATVSEITEISTILNVTESSTEPDTTEGHISSAVTENEFTTTTIETSSAFSSTSITAPVDPTPSTDVDKSESILTGDIRPSDTSF